MPVQVQDTIITAVALALLTSIAYFYAGLSKKGLSYFGKYIQPTPILLPPRFPFAALSIFNFFFRVLRDFLWAQASQVIQS